MPHRTLKGRRGDASGAGASIDVHRSGILLSDTTILECFVVAVRLRRLVRVSDSVPGRLKNQRQVR